METLTHNFCISSQPKLNDRNIIQHLLLEYSTADCAELISKSQAVHLGFVVLLGV